MRNACLILLNLLLLTAGFAQEYSVQEIPLMPGLRGAFGLPGWRGIQRLNLRGEMLANFFNQDDKVGCFVFQQSGWRELTLEGRPVFGMAMNRRGDVVGEVLGSNDVTRPFLFSKGQGAEIPVEGSIWANATDINDHGDLVGMYFTPNWSQLRAFVRRNGNIQDLGRLTGDTYPLINNSREIALGVLVSNRAGIVILSKHATNVIGTWQSFQFAMNNRGHVVGYARLRPDSQLHAFLYRDGDVYDLQDPGEPFGTALDINDDGQIVGWYQTPLDDGTVYDQGFVYAKGQRRKLSDVVQQDGTWDFGIPVAINNHGVIAGLGRRNGQPSFYLLTPLKRHP